MFITDEMLKEAAERWGQPGFLEFSFEVRLEEYNRIKSSQKKERAHDVTFYILKDDQVVVIAKPFYPPDLFRAPSGGLKVGESLAEGIKREAREETGCEIEIERFLLSINVSFVCRENERVIDWTSHIFKADYISGDFKFTDTDEIREVKLADWSEFDNFSAIMRRTEIGGLHYRAALHEAVVARMKELNLLAGS